MGYVDNRGGDAMLGHSCDVCGHPAVIHDTKIVGGVAADRHLCRDHGEASWRDALGDCDARVPAALSLVDDLRRMAGSLRPPED